MRLAIIGGWGHAYLRQLLNRPGYAFDQPVAVASDGCDSPRAKELADALGAPAAFFDSIDDMLDQYKPDVVNVAAVYGYAGDINAKVLARGIPVVTDKPAAATWEQLEKLKSLVGGGAKDRPRLITEFNFRCNPEFRAARDAVAAGLIGNVVMATAQKSYRFGTRPSWYGDRAAYGSTLLWVASHGIDLVHFVTGQTFTKVTGRLGNLSHPELPAMDDHCLSLFGLSGGGSAMVHADLLRPGKSATHGDDRLRVIGTAGQIEVRGGACKLTTNGAAEVDITSQATPRPAAEELFAAVTGESGAIFSTAHSLYMAELLLHARDAADREEWVELG